MDAYFVVSVGVCCFWGGWFLSRLVTAILYHLERQ